MTRPRVEDPRLVIGAGSYVADLCGTTTLHCWFTRSPMAHARITGIDTDAARAAPGVAAVLTADDLGLADIPGQVGRGPDPPEMPRPPLARGRVRYVGEPIAVVVAETPALAEDAAGLVWVDLEEEGVAAGPDTALDGEFLLFPDAGTNVVARTSIVRGPEPRGTPAVSVTIVTESRRLAPMPIEPLAILASEDAGRLRVWCGHQAPHRFRSQLAALLGRDAESIRIIVPDVGGAFGMKGMLYPEFLVVAAIAGLVDRPVAWIQTRREHYSGGTHGRGQRHRVTLDGDDTGRISRARVAILADTGAYPHNGSQIPMFSSLVATGLYDIPRVELETTVVVTNRAPVGSYRGAGRPEAALAIERAVDAFARSAGLDPFQVRLMNMIRPEQLPHRTPTDALYDSGNYPLALEAAMTALGLDELREEQRRRWDAGDDPLGVGVGAFIERAGGAVDSGEYARVDLDPDRRSVVVRVGSTDTGQGHATVWSRLARDVFQTEGVVVRAGDTDEVAMGVGTFASRSAQVAGSAVLRVSQAVLERARARAADRLEAAVEDVEYSAGTFRVAGSPGSEVTIWSLAAEAPLADEEMFVPGAQTFPYGVHAAVVEVATATGEVRVLRVVAVDDCGRVLDPMIVEGQVFGSLTQGLGQALFEEVRYDEFGQLLTGSLVDYSIPTSVDMPPIDALRLEHPAPSNPLGAKGTGEAGCIGLPPAILNAVIDALWPMGVRDLQLPLRPSRVWEALRGSKRASS